MTDDDRRELAELFRQDDRLRAEREATASPPVRENEAEGILYRTTEQNAQAPAAVMDGAPSDDDPMPSDEVYPPYSVLMQIISQFVVTWTNRKLAGLHREVGRLKKEMKVLHQQVDADTERGIEVYCTNVERRLATLEGETIKLKSMLDNRGKRR
jgi:hypothetical protein